MALNEIIRNESVAVGTSPVILTDQIREGQIVLRTVVNTSTAGQIITLVFATGATTPVSGAGIVLYPGGTFSESVDNKYQPTNCRLYAIGSAASGTLAVYERLVI